MQNMSALDLKNQLMTSVFDETLPSFPSTSPRTVNESFEVGNQSITKYTNEFWTAKQRQSNSIHEISYRACFKAELPRFFIKRLTREGDVVYDPFMGRGTTLVEAALLGRIPFGNDINPLSKIMVEPRLSPPEFFEIENRLKNIPLEIASLNELDIDLSMFYSDKTLIQLLSLGKYLDEKKKIGEEDVVDKWIRMVATNRLTGHSSGFFSVYTLPPNQAVTPESQIKINSKKNQIPPDRDVKAIILKKSKSLLKNINKSIGDNLSRNMKKVKLFQSDASNTSGILDNSVDLVVTSPPFLDIVDYARDNWLRCWFNNINVEKVKQSISIHKKIEDWNSFMLKVFAQLKRILKPGGWIAFEVGEVRNGKYRLDEEIAPIGIEAGLLCKMIVINQQQFTKTANCWGVSNNSKGTNTNRIVIFQKEQI